MFRYVLVISMLALLASCKHPLAIVGEGDIVDRNGTGAGCTLEQFRAGDAACENDVRGDYFVNYEAVPREGWRFSRWEGACGRDSVFPDCRFDMPGSLVSFWDENYPGIGVGTLTAVFEQNGAATSQRYTFNGSFAEAGGGAPLVHYAFTDWYTITEAGNTYRDYPGEAPSFQQSGNDSFITLGPRDYLGFDPGVLDGFDLGQPASIALRFKFEVDSPSNSSPCCPDSLFRYIVGTNATDQRDIGFALQVEAEEGDDGYALILTSGDGREFKDGYRRRLSSIEPGRWVSLKLFFYLADSGNARLTALVDGAPFTLVYDDIWSADPALVRDFLEGNVPGDGTYLPGASVGVTTPSLFVGAFPEMEPHNAEFSLSIDEFSIEAPVVGASTAELVQALELLTAHLNGDTQGESAREQALVTVAEGFVGNWEGIRPAALAFFDSFASAERALFVDDQLRSPADFSVEEKLVYFLQQWLMDNHFQGSFDSADAGIAFADANRFPGPVRASAPRLAGAVGIDGSYATDPGYHLNDEATVIRPTGYYAAPGEVVTVTVPEAVAQAGLSLRVGFQRADMEAGLWDVFNRFPRISSRYALDKSSLEVANPFGGGLYVEVPNGTSLGTFTMQVSGAVKMPMYSTLDLVGHSNDLTAFQAEADAWNVPWFEMHGRNFSATLPMNEVRLYTDPGALLARFDEAFDAIGLMSGRPLERIRPEWLSYDRNITHWGTALAASYPIYPHQELGEVGEYWASSPNYGSPHVLMRSDFFFDRDVNDPASIFDPRVDNYTLFHEWGHLHNLPTLNYQELESNVHLLAAVVYHRVMGGDIDLALAWSGFQFFTRDQAALDTMLSPNWQAGTRLDEATFNGVWDNELRYQTRSWARIVEIAALYGWEAVGDIHRVFYERGVQQGEAVNYGVEDDDFIESASTALQINLSPLFDFWGVPPSAGLASRLAQYPVPAEFEARLTHYLSLVPADNAAFEAVYTSLAPTNGGAVEARLDFYRDAYDTGYAATIRGRIEGLLCRYYGCPQ